VKGPVAERIRTEQLDGREANAFIVESCAKAPDPAQAAVPTGYALPPVRDGDLPPISGVPPDLVFTEPDREVSRIRFWLPKDVVPLAERALDHARRTARDPLKPTWVYLEIILVHFIRTIDNPVARAANRRHPILVRDHFRCIIPGCMCRGGLESHHFKHRSEGGPDVGWNQAAGCGCHHRLGVHIGGTIEIGGWAPAWVITKLGIHPKTGRAFISYINEREVIQEVADRELGKWRRWEREWEAARDAGIELPLPPIPGSVPQRPEVDRNQPVNA
jgi:hypothetical protein